MLTEVEIQEVAPAEAFWTVSQIAERDGISRQAVSKRVKDLSKTHGLTVSRSLNGSVTAINVVQYDLLRSRFGDQSQVRVRKDPAPDPSVRPAVDSKSYDEATRRRAWLDMEKRRLEVAELRGLLLRADRVGQAIGFAADEMARTIDRLPQKAEEIAVELKCEDVHSVRLMLKRLAREIRTDLSNAFAAAAAAAPETDDPLPDFEEDEG